MKNKVMSKLFSDLRIKIEKFRPSTDRTQALKHLDLCEAAMEKADEDGKHNPPGKAVIRNDDGEVIALQG